MYPVFPILLGFILFITLKYFEPACFYLCDSLTLDELKDNLVTETVSYNKAMKELDDIENKMKVAIQEKDYELANDCDFDAECKADDICKIFYKIKDIEENVKKIDPLFESSIEEPYFL